MVILGKPLEGSVEPIAIQTTVSDAFTFRNLFVQSDRTDVRDYAFDQARLYGVPASSYNHTVYESHKYFLILERDEDPLTVSAEKFFHGLVSKAAPEPGSLSNVTEVRRNIPLSPASSEEVKLYPSYLLGARTLRNLLNG